MSIKVEKVCDLPVLYLSEELTQDDFGPVRESESKGILFILEGENEWTIKGDKEVINIRLKLAPDLYEKLKVFKEYASISAPLYAVYKTEVPADSENIEELKEEARTRVYSEAIFAVSECIQTFNSMSLLKYSSN